MKTVKIKFQVDDKQVQRAERWLAKYETRLDRVLKKQRGIWDHPTRTKKKQK